jgi:hypothetical protein
MNKKQPGLLLYLHSAKDAAQIKVDYPTDTTEECLVDGQIYPYTISVQDIKSSKHYASLWDDVELIGFGEPILFFWCDPEVVKRMNNNTGTCLIDGIKKSYTDFQYTIDTDENPDYADDPNFLGRGVIESRPKPVKYKPHPHNYLPGANGYDDGSGTYAGLMKRI